MSGIKERIGKVQITENWFGSLLLVELKYCYSQISMM